MGSHPVHTGHTLHHLNRYHGIVIHVDFISFASCFLFAELSLEYFIEDSSEMEQMDITNKTLSLPIATQNVWVMTGSSHPDPLKDVVPVWFFNDEVLIAMEHPHGVEQHGSKLKFTRILESREQEGNYTIRIGSYSVSFLLVVGK